MQTPLPRSRQMILLWRVAGAREFISPLFREVLLSEAYIRLFVMHVQERAISNHTGLTAAGL